MMKKATREALKRHNLRLVLQTIDHQGEISRADVARLTHLTRPTVSNIVAGLMDRSLVVETGQGPSAGGKRPTLLRMAHEAYHLIGLDLGDGEFRGALLDLHGRVLQRRQREVTGQGSAAEAALKQVYQLIDELLALASVPVLGIGMGTPGIIDSQQGLVRQAVNLDWRDLPLGPMLSTRYRLPVYIANDCQIAALGERRFGEWQDIANMLLVKAGQGIGSGIIINGQLYFGDGYGAGEIGHMRLVEPGERCRCGHEGCLETVASSRALISQARRLAVTEADSALNRLVSDPAAITVDVLQRALQAGDSGVAAIVDEAAGQLGRAISFMVSTLSINHVVLAGSLAHFDLALIEPVQKMVNAGALPAVARSTQVHRSRLGDDIVILGAAALVLTQELGLV